MKDFKSLKGQLKELKGKIHLRSTLPYCYRISTEKFNRILNTHKYIHPDQNHKTALVQTKSRINKENMTGVIFNHCKNRTSLTKWELSLVRLCDSKIDELLSMCDGIYTVEADIH